MFSCSMLHEVLGALFLRGAGNGAGGAGMLVKLFSHPQCHLQVAQLISSQPVGEVSAVVVRAAVHDSGPRA